MRENFRRTRFGRTFGGRLPRLRRERGEKLVGQNPRLLRRKRPRRERRGCGTRRVRRPLRYGHGERHGRMFGRLLKMFGLRPRLKTVAAENRRHRKAVTAEKGATCKSGKSNKIQVSRPSSPNLRAAFFADKKRGNGVFDKKPQKLPKHGRISLFYGVFSLDRKKNRWYN